MDRYIEYIVFKEIFIENIGYKEKLLKYTVFKKMFIKSTLCTKRCS